MRKKKFLRPVNKKLWPHLNTQTTTYFYSKYNIIEVLECTYGTRKKSFSTLRMKYDIIFFVHSKKLELN